MNPFYLVLVPGNLMARILWLSSGTMDRVMYLLVFNSADDHPITGHASIS